MEQQLEGLVKEMGLSDHLTFQVRSEEQKRYTWSLDISLLYLGSRWVGLDYHIIVMMRAMNSGS